MSDVTFYRSSGWAWGGRRFLIEVDGTPVGWLGRKQRLNTPVAPGKHVLRAKVGRFTSPDLNVELVTDSELKVAVRPILPPKGGTKAERREALLLVITADFGDVGPKLRDVRKMKRPPSKKYTDR